MVFSLRAVIATMALAITPSLQTSVPVTTIESYSTVFSEVTPTVTDTSSGTQTGCPTVTLTSSICSTCITPACAELEALTQSCDCPSAIPTVFVDFPCGGENACSGIGCAADYVFFTANCTEPTSTSDGSSSNTTSTSTSTSTSVGGVNGTVTTTGVNSTVTSTASTSRASENSSDTAGTSLATTASLAMAGRMRPFWMGWM